jgi:4-aminobutyrate aminotransferase-like enzyme
VRFPLDVHLRDVAVAETRALAQAHAAFATYSDDIACFVAEPIQGEGSDNHLRAEFLQAIQQLCRERDALSIPDEVQTGCGATGTAWAYLQLGLHIDRAVMLGRWLLAELTGLADARPLLTIREEEIALATAAMDRVLKRIAL